MTDRDGQLALDGSEDDMRYNISFGDVRERWTQAPIDRLLQQQQLDGSMADHEPVVNWRWTEERVGETPEYALRVEGPDGRALIWVPSAYNPLGGTWWPAAATRMTRVPTPSIFRSADADIRIRMGLEDGGDF